MSSSRHFCDGPRQEKSNYVNTCNLLGQYMKQKGSLRDFNLESLQTIVMNTVTNKGKSSQPLTEQQPSTAPDSSIKIDKDASNKATSKEEATMTIFYGGRMLIFDDYPAGKAKELIALAKKGSSKMSYAISSTTLLAKLNSGGSAASSSTVPPPAQPPCSSDKEGAAGCVAMASSSSGAEHISPQPEGNGSDLPIARRSSLHRFLGKRKDRAAARGPYQLQEQPPSSSKADEELELKL